MLLSHVNKALAATTFRQAALRDRSRSGWPANVSGGQQVHPKDKRRSRVGKILCVSNLSAPLRYNLSS